MMQLAQEYRRSAQTLLARIEELKRGGGEEERIMLLQAEYYHLLRTAHYLEHYYDEDTPQDTEVTA